MEPRSEGDWDAMVRTADAVRVPMPAGATLLDHKAPRRSRRRGLARTAQVLAAGGLLAAVAWPLRTPPAAAADANADGSLFTLTNQDRASNGVAALRGNQTLGNIGESSPYSGCPGMTVNGRSEDMIQRDYFSHVILNCGQYVFSMMQAAGIAYSSAGENIGWLSGASSASSAASTIEQQFMNSPDHRANILNPNYTDIGIGSWNSGANAWTYAGLGASYPNVWMFSEEFAQIGSPPPPPPQPTPVPTQPPRNSPAPTPVPTPVPTAEATPEATPAPTPVPTPKATPVPTPAPTPTPTPTPAPAAGTSAPLVQSGGGVLADSVESVLTTFFLGG